VDEEGYAYLVGRRKEVIIRFGFNVYPREVEDCLHAHLAVREAAVVGVPNKVPDRVRFFDDCPLTGTGKIWHVELARVIQAEQQSRRVLFGVAHGAAQSKLRAWR